MKLDLAVVGAPFLDLTFEGLPRLPRLGEEVVANSLHIAPGGTGMQAIGAARLGLATALVAPIGDGCGAELLRALLEAEGVDVVGQGGHPGHDEPEPEGPGVPTTALLATPGGVAMATALQGREPTAWEVAAAPARAVVASLGRLALAPPGAAVYAVTGGLELGRVDEATLERLGRARAFVLNAEEAASLTGRREPEQAALELARRVDMVAITMGGKGALVARNERVAFVPARDGEVVDATGAGDLFTSAFVWADLRGATPDACLAWASLYAGLSVRAPTAYAGAVRLKELLREGDTIGLRLPNSVPSGPGG